MKEEKIITESMAKGHTVLEVGADGVAIITIVNPPVNSLSFDGTILLFHRSGSFILCIEVLKFCIFVGMI